jgi:hypothetical protein
MHNHFLDGIALYIQNLLVEQMITQACNRLEIEETLVQITERDRKSSKSLLRRKHELRQK